MRAPNPVAITELLNAAHQGDQAAFSRLVEVIYAELHQRAHCLMKDERPGHMLQTTALVNEALLRLCGGDLTKLANRSMLYSACARAMRQLLVEHARARDAIKRGGRMARAPLDEVLDDLAKIQIDVIALHEAIERLEQVDPRQRAFIDLTFFGGRSKAEIAEMYGLSTESVRLILEKAKCCLRELLKPE